MMKCTAADIEMAELVYAGNTISRLRKKGICLHGWVCAPAKSTAKCLDCGKVWPSAEEMEDEQRELRIEFL